MATEVLAAELHDLLTAAPSPDAEAFSAMMPPAPDPFAGLPGMAAAIEMIGLQRHWPYDATARARIAELAGLWSPDARRIFREQFGVALPSGAHWPDEWPPG